MSRTEAAVAGGTRRKTIALAVPPAGQRALIVTLITILLWTGEILEPGVAALVGVTLLALSGATGSLRDALQGFANPVPFFLIGVLTMGVAVVRCGLAERLARTILERSRGKSLAVYLQLVFSFPILTFVLPSATTRSGILIHIYDEVFSLGGVRRGADVAKAIMLALSSINRLASTTLLTGGITPVMSAAIIGGMSWTGWFTLMAVPYYAILFMGGVLTYALYHRGFSHGLPLPPRAPPPPVSPARGGAEGGITPVVCALVVMITGDAVVYYPAQSSSALVIYERGHVSAGEVLRFGLWMTLVGWIAILVVALPWWALVGEPLRPR